MVARHACHETKRVMVPSVAGCVNQPACSIVGENFVRPTFAFLLGADSLMNSQKNPPFRVLYRIQVPP